MSPASGVGVGVLFALGAFLEYRAKRRRRERERRERLERICRATRKP